MGVFNRLELLRTPSSKLAFSTGFVILLLGAVTSIVVAFRASTYRSNALLSYAAAASTDASQSPAADSLAAAALDDAHLTMLMDQFGLYARQRKEEPPDQVIKHMRSDIELKPLNSAALSIAFTGQQPIVV